MDSTTTANGSAQQEQAQSIWHRYLQEGFDYKRPKRGTIVKGTILEKSPEEVVVDIGVKREGLVPAHDLKRLDEDTIGELEVGHEIPVFIEHTWDRNGDLIVSIARGKELEDWERAIELLESGEVLELQITGSNRGGATAQFGQLRGFIPASHLQSVPRGLATDQRQDAIGALVGKVVRLKVIEVDRDRRRLILSEREGERLYRRQRRQELLDTMQVGDVVTGVVSSLASFGAFVDLGGAEGLLHVSEISFDRVDRPGDALESGQEVSVMVIRLDQKRKRIGLSIRRLLPDPWKDIQQRYYPGQLVEATIDGLTDFGAFAQLEPGIKGLIHVSQLASGHVTHPQEVVTEGELVMVRILHIDLERKRIGLSMKDAAQWIEADAEQETETIEVVDQP